jgi:tRNA(Ile)-lysidine synthase
MRNDSLYEALENFWLHHVPSSSRICVAVSGGVDSVALFHLLAHLRKRLSIADLGIAHVNHCLRGRESDGDASFVESIAKKAGVAFHCARLPKKKIPSRGIEAWARDRRYSFFASVIKKHGYDFVATAHTADDQAETVLLRLLRGTGIRGLAGIAPKRDDRVIRPLLAVRKKALVKWLHDNKISFREDSSNKNTDFTRNWIRHRFLPGYVKKEPDCIRLLAGIAENAGSIEKTIDGIINKWTTSYVVEKGKAYFSVNKKGFSDASIASEAVMSLLRERGVEFDRAHIESIAENKDKNGKTFLLPSAWQYRCWAKTVDFYKKGKVESHGSFSCFLKRGAVTPCKRQKCAFIVEKYPFKSMAALSFSDPMKAFLDAEAVKGILVFRSFEPHEKFWPYGAKGYAEMSEFLKKQKRCKHEREHMGVVSMKNGEIVWIVGLRIGHRFRITPHTREILKISCKIG